MEVEDINFIASPASFYRTSTRFATEDITTGEMWSRLLKDINKTQQAPNDVEASIILQQKMQKEEWPNGLDSINALEPHLKRQILPKSPFFDEEDNLIKVGGRLELSDLSFGRKHPTLIPDTELGDALIGYLHNQIHHQGRKITASHIREQGFEPVGGRKRICRLISACISCRILRAPLMKQKMADLPETRLHQTPPSTTVVLTSLDHFTSNTGKRPVANLAPENSGC